MNRKRPLVVACVLAVAAAGWYAASRPVTQADLRAAGLSASWRTPDYPDWVPGWLADRLPERSPRPQMVVSLRHDWGPDADRVLARLRPHEAFELTDCGLTDASLRQLLRRHPALWLNVNGTRLTAAGVREAAAAIEAGGGRMWADVPAVGDRQLVELADAFPSGELDETLARRLARSFTGGHADDTDPDFSHFESFDWSGAAAEGPDGTLRHTRVLSPGDVGLRLSGVSEDTTEAGLDVVQLSLEFEPAAGGPGRAALTADQTRLLTAIRRPDFVHLRNVGLAPPAGGLPAWELLMWDNPPAGVVPALSRVRGAMLRDWRHGDGPLASLRVSGGGHVSVWAGGGEPLTGAFLASARLPDCRSLSVEGTLRRTDDAPPVRVSPAVTGPRELRLSGVAVDGASLVRLAGGVDDLLSLSELPCVRAGDVAASLEGRAIDFVELGPGVPLDAAALRAAAVLPPADPSRRPVTRIDHRVVPAPPVTRAALEGVPRPLRRRVTIDMVGTPETEATAALRAALD